MAGFLRWRWGRPDTGKTIIRSLRPGGKRVSRFGQYRWGAGVLLAALICAVLAASGLDSTASAQGATTDHDADHDGLIEVTTEPQLNAIRWDLDGSGVVDAPANATNYAAAFPSAAQEMGCPGSCTGYEVAANISPRPSPGPW